MSITSRPQQYLPSVRAIDGDVTGGTDGPARIPAGRKGPWEAPVDALILTLTILFLLSYFDPGVLLNDTVVAGGDTLSHYFTAHYLTTTLLPEWNLTGWSQGNLAGFPILQMYFPLPFLMTAFLGLFMPLTVAFKLVTVSGTFLLPIATYVFLRLLRFPFPAPASGAAAVLAFLFVESNGMWGGNIPSTLAGEFAHSLSLAMMMVSLGLIYRAATEGEHFAKTVLLVAAMGMTHACPLIFFSGACLMFLLRRRHFVSRAWRVLTVGLTAFLLIGFWIVPFLWSLPCSTPFTFRWVFGSVKEVLPPVLTPVMALGAIGSVVVLRAGRFRGNPEAGRLGFLWGCVMLGPVLYYMAPGMGIVDIRFLPFSHLFLAVIGGTAPALCLRRFHGSPMVPLALFCAVAAWASTMTNYIPERIRFNYRGMESKPLWQAYRKVNDELAGSIQAPRVVYEHSPRYRQAGGIRAFELFPLFSGRSTLEGVYLQSSLSSPFIFYVQSEVSREASWPLIRYNYSRLNPKKGIEHLEMFNVGHFVAVSEKVKEAMGRRDDVRLAKEIPPFSIYEILENLDRYVIPLRHAPVLLPDKRDWRRISYDWFRRGDPEVHLVFNEDAETGHEARFEKGFTGDVSVLPRRRLPEADAARIGETIRQNEVSFHTPYLGLPHLIRISYHPNWEVEGAGRIYLASPSFMLVYPEEETVTLRYQSGFAGYAGCLLSIAGVFLLLVAGRKRLRAPRFLEVRGKTLHRAFLMVFAGAGAAVLLLYDHRDPYIMHNRAQAWFEKEDYGRARSGFEAAMNRFPVSPVIDDTMMQYAFCFFREGQWNKAADALQSLLDRFPETRRAAEAWYHIGLCRQRTGAMREAMHCYDRVVVCFPDSRWAELAADRLSKVGPKG